MHRKAQVSIELLFVIVVLLLIFSFVTFNYILKSKESRELEASLDIKELCSSFSNLVYSVYKSGDGTTANFTTKKIVTLFGNGSIAIQDILNVTTVNIVAVSVSEAGETTQVFYDLVNNQLSPDWYKNCFDDIDGTGCSSSGTDVNYALIPNNISDLMANIDDYDVIYLEDSHIQFNASYGGRLYADILRDWVAQGNSLIAAEHLFCREQSSGSYSVASYRCNPPGSYNSDTWKFMNITFYQRGGNGYTGNDVIVVRDDPLFDLTTGQQFDFEEHSYLEELFPIKKIESESGSLVSGFVSTANCLCNNPATSNGTCIRHTGSTTVPANATFVSGEPSGRYNMTVRFCGENDGNDQWWVFVNNTLVAAWNTSGGEPNWQDRSIQNLTINPGTQIKLRCDRANSNTFCRSDFIELKSGPDIPVVPLTIVANYTSAAISGSRFKPAIAHFTYGNGTVYYFADFQVAPSQQSQYSQVIADLIETVVLLSLSDKTTICTSPVNTNFYQLSGKIVIRNENNKLILSNSSS